MNNYQLYIETIKELAKSQGFYSLLYQSYCAMNTKQKRELRRYLNSLPKFSGPVDVILMMEQ